MKLIIKSLIPCIIMIFIVLVYSCSENDILVLNPNDDEPIGIEYPSDNHEKITINQGVWGNVWFWEGDFMPFYPDGIITPVVREIYIHQATPYTSVMEDSLNRVFFTEINSKFITKTVSDSDGFFQITLFPGK